MAKVAGDFTFGGQLFEAYWNMFVSSLKPILYIASTFGGLAALWYGYSRLVKDDLYYLIMRAFAATWNAIGLNADKVLELKGYGDRIPIRMRNVHLFEPMKDAMDRWGFVLGMSAAWFVLGFGVALFVYPQIAIYIAQKQRQRTNERGASVTTAEALQDMLAVDNEARAKLEQAADQERRKLSAKGAGEHDGGDQSVAPDGRSPAGEAGGGGDGRGRSPEPYTPYSVAGFEFPWRHETTHLFAMGTTGAGKSTVLKDILTQARARGDRAVVFDVTGTFIEAFYDATKDTILNPLDVRCPRWSIFNECANRVELHTAARALIPSDGGRGDPFWIEAARLMLVEACQKLIEADRRTNQALYDEIMTSLLPSLHKRLQGTLAGPLTEPEARRMAESVRAVLNANAHAIQLLPEEGADFSIRRWVREDDGQGRILFIAAQTTHLDTLRSLLTLWYDTAIHGLMGMPASPDRLRMWFIFDELGALHRLPSLEDGMRTARNFGGAFALGIHTIQQLWSVYGQHEGDTIASLGRTQLYLTQPDYRSAEWCSAMIGKSEYRETERSTTVGVERLRDGVGWTQKTEYRPIALPEQVMGLPSLRGYIKFPEGYPTALIDIVYRAYPKRSEGFVSRQDLKLVVAMQETVAPRQEEGEDQSDSMDLKAEATPPAPEKVGQEASAPAQPVSNESKAESGATARSRVRGVAAKGRTDTGKVQPPEETKGGEGPAKGKGSKGGAKPKAEPQAVKSSEGPALERRMGPEVAYPSDDLEMGAD